MLEVLRCWAPRVYATLCHIITTRGRGEQSIDMQGEDNKKRVGRGQGAAANTWGDHDSALQDLRAKATLTWAMVGRVKSGFIGT